MKKFTFVTIASTLALSGCMTPPAPTYVSSRSSQTLTQQPVVVSQTTGVGECMKARMRHVKADPSRLKIQVATGSEVATREASSTVGYAPPIALASAVTGAVMDIGFTIVMDLPPAENTAYQVRAVVASFEPLSSSSSTNVDADLLWVTAGAKNQFVFGSVVVAATVFRRDRDGYTVAMANHAIRIPFWQDKRSLSIGAGLKTGVSGGKSWEVVQIKGVVDATQLAAKHATHGVLSKAFAMECT